MFALLTAEVRRLLAWRRLAVAFVGLALVSWPASESLLIRARDGGFGVNAWDVPLEAINNFALLTLVLLPLFLIVVGDVAVRDRTSGYIAMTGTRFSSATTWWVSKLAAVAAASVAFFGLSMLTMLAVGAMTFGGVGSDLSEYGRAFPRSFGTAAEIARFYGPPPLPQLHAALRTALVFAYTAVAVWAYASLYLVASLRWPKPWVPVLAGIVGTVALWAVPPVTVLHPLAHLSWDIHTFSVTNLAVTWWSSSLYIPLQVVAAAVGGAAVLRRQDLWEVKS